jgi:hypothetical protein
LDIRKTASHRLVEGVLKPRYDGKVCHITLSGW